MRAHSKLGGSWFDYRDTNDSWFDHTPDYCNVYSCDVEGTFVRKILSTINGSVFVTKVTLIFFVSYL